MPDLHGWIALAIMVLITAFLRFLPFLIWGGKRKTPKIIEKLGKTLPFAVIGMLIIYCLKDINFLAYSSFLPPLISGIVTVLLYLWRRNTLLSVLAGTVCNMLLVQLVF
jgi:branched-subunit amino acid transport protein AzlD